MGKRVAEHWYAIKALDSKVLWIREIHVDPYVAGDMWLVRGSKRDLVVDTGMGIVPPAPVIEALTTNPNRSAGGRSGCSPEVGKMTGGHKKMSFYTIRYPFILIERSFNIH